MAQGEESLAAADLLLLVEVPDIREADRSFISISAVPLKTSGNEYRSLGIQA
jgi:hypothetical protein